MRLFQAVLTSVLVFNFSAQAFADDSEFIESTESTRTRWENRKVEQLRAEQEIEDQRKKEREDRDRHREELIGSRPYNGSGLTGQLELRGSASRLTRSSMGIGLSLRGIHDEAQLGSGSLNQGQVDPGTGGLLIGDAQGSLDVSQNSEAGTEIQRAHGSLLLRHTFRNVDRRPINLMVSLGNIGVMADLKRKSPYDVKRAGVVIEPIAFETDLPISMLRVCGLGRAALVLGSNEINDKSAVAAMEYDVSACIGDRSKYVELNGGLRANVLFASDDQQKNSGLGEIELYGGLNVRPNHWARIGVTLSKSKVSDGTSSVTDDRVMASIAAVAR